MGEVTWKTFWQAGGFGMYEVAAFGLTALLAAVHFALRPDERLIPFFRAMTIATLFAMALGISSDVGEVFRYVPTVQQSDAEMTRMVMQGLFESSTPAQLGFALLSLAWVVHAIGLRRLGRMVP